MSKVTDSSPWLTSWTRTLNEEDALVLLGAASPGDTLASWTEEGHRVLPQPSRPRRTEMIRMVRKHLLDLTPDDRIADTRYLELIRTGHARLRLDLMWGRYLFGHPWIDRALRELVHPALEASDELLAAEDADVIDEASWETFVARQLKPGTGPAAVRKSRSQVIRGLGHLGVVVHDAEAGCHRARHAEPEKLAFGWLVARELEVTGEMSEHRAARTSKAARLYATTPAYAEQCLAESVDAGLLKRGHLVGQAQLYPGER